MGEATVEFAYKSPVGGIIREPRPLSQEAVLIDGLNQVWDTIAQGYPHLKASYLLKAAGKHTLSVVGENFGDVPLIVVRYLGNPDHIAMPEYLASPGEKNGLEARWNKMLAHEGLEMYQRDGRPKDMWFVRKLEIE